MVRMCCLCQDETGPVLSGTSGLMFADLVSDEVDLVILRLAGFAWQRQVFEGLV